MTGLLDLASEKYVRLTTFRRDGTPVATPVWLVGGDGELLVITGSTTGKVKRLRHTARVLLAACDARGRAKPGAVEHEGVAELVEDPAEAERIGRAVTRRYGVLGRVLAVAERLRGGRRPVGIRIRPSAGD
ncbi:MAG: PPOX class F420-dependent oxidoreductase [Kineosporiaceae bacterium]